MLESIFQMSNLVALITLTVLEIVLGIDNVIFLSLLVAKLPKEQRHRARTGGLLFAMLTRIILLISLVWMSHLTRPLFSLGEYVISGRTLVLGLGGLFLLIKSTQEIHNTLEPEQQQGATPQNGRVGFWGVIVQIGLIDIVFSLDSVITAIGMANVLPIMILAVMLSVVVMLFAAKRIEDIILKHPTLKMLALCFLILVSVALLADACGLHIPRAYIYFGMAFSIFVEVLNIRLRRTIAH